MYEPPCTAKERRRIPDPHLAPNRRAGPWIGCCCCQGVGSALRDRPGLCGRLPRVGVEAPLRLLGLRRGRLHDRLPRVGVEAPLRLLGLGRGRLHDCALDDRALDDRARPRVLRGGGLVGGLRHLRYRRLRGVRARPGPASGLRASGLWTEPGRLYGRPYGRRFRQLHCF